MLFNSLIFFLFLGVVYSLYLILPFRGQNWLLIVAGYVFYGFWDVRFLFLIACSTCVDYTIGVLLENRELERKTGATASLFLLGVAVVCLVPDWSADHPADILRPTRLGVLTAVGTLAFIAASALGIRALGRLKERRRRKLLVTFSVAINLLFLGTFKYFNFFIDSGEALLGALGYNAESFHLNVILPVGISFYTFQSLSYTIDVYRRVIRPAPRFFDFALFVAYFPPMVAGPIERARHLLPQLTRPRRVRALQVGQGIGLIILGLMKKVAVADGLAPAVNSIYASTGAVSQLDVAAATVLFAFQILCDFSGYSDIARGVSKLLGIELSYNFHSPYLSRSPSEFWRRWHMSLSSWLRDYLYISLGGNRKGNVRTHFNLFVTMLLGGLWHGAAWNYVLWGAYQGALLSGHRMLSGTRSDGGHGADAQASRSGPFGIRSALEATVKTGVFFVFVCYGWMLFRAGSLDQVVSFTQTLFGFGAGSGFGMSKPTIAAAAGLLVVILCEINDYRTGNINNFLRWSVPAQGVLFAVAMYVIAMGLSNEPAQFIYFQF